MKSVAFATLLAIVVLGTGSQADALMTSTNYRIYGDAVGTSGGRSTSASYILTDTVGELDADEMSSTNYNLLAGFQNISEHPTFSFSVDTTSINLGNLSPTSVQTGTSTITTSTNAPFGYTTTIVEDGELRTSSNIDIDDVSDGAVTAGSEEYGIALIGTDRTFVDERAISTTPLSIASRSNWKNNSQVTVTHRASVASNTLSGSYSHVVTYVSTGNF
jgi:hypothetical protein